MTNKYFFYAIGEITLVIVGILVALAIDNYRGEQADKQYERFLLAEIRSVLLQDKADIDQYYIWRLERKEEGIAELMRAAATDESITDSRFLELFSFIGIDFRFTYNSAAYEALKTSGLNRLSNDDLRSSLIDFYDATLPSHNEFIRDANEDADRLIEPLREEILAPRIVARSFEDFEFTNEVIVDDVLSHSAFLRILELENIKAENQRRRLETVINRYDELIAVLGDALEG